MLAYHYISFLGVILLWRAIARPISPCVILEIDIPDDPGGRLRVASAEDTVLAKLEWYAITPSDRQWRDVQAILRVQGTALDLDYLQQWAAELGIMSLLRQALTGQPPPPADDVVEQLPRCRPRVPHVCSFL